MALGLSGRGIPVSSSTFAIETDGLHGKHTLATILGRSGAIWELIALDALAYADLR